MGGLYSIQNYNNPFNRQIRQICKTFITKEYTWNNVVNKWEMIFKK